MWIMLVVRKSVFIRMLQVLEEMQRLDIGQSVCPNDLKYLDRLIVRARKQLVVEKQ